MPARWCWTGTRWPRACPARGRCGPDAGGRTGVERGWTAQRRRRPAGWTARRCGEPDQESVPGGAVEKVARFGASVLQEVLAVRAAVLRSGQAGSQASLRCAAMAWVKMWDMLATTGWTPGPLASSPRCQVTLFSGAKHSTDGLMLNPCFTDWIMGWPTGWTDPLQPVTGWSRWLQRARGGGAGGMLKRDLKCHLRPAASSTV